MDSSTTSLQNHPAASNQPQQLIVLAGVVGSGKSTFSQALCRQLPNWSRVNQDDLGDRRACEAMVRSGLAAGKNVVVDRQNFDEPQRRTWLEIATEFPGVLVGGLVMGTTEAECAQRLRTRTNHPTIGDPVLAIELLDKFLNLWSEPQLSEGYDHLLTLPSLPPSSEITPDLLAALLASLWASPLNPDAQEQRQPRSNRAPRAGYAPPRGGGGGGQAGWGAPVYRPHQQQQSSWGGPPAWGGQGRQLGAGGGGAGQQPGGGSSWAAGPPHAWGGAGQTLGGSGRSGARPPAQ